MRIAGISLPFFRYYFHFFEKMVYNYKLGTFLEVL